MAKVQIDGIGVVEVDDSFLSASEEVQQSVIDQIKSEAGAKSASPSSSGGLGLGSGRYIGQQTAVQPGHEISTLDEIASAEELQKGNVERYDYEPERVARAERFAEQMRQAWDGLPQEERDAILNEGQIPSFIRGVVDGVSPVPARWLQSPETAAKWAVAKGRHGKAFDRGSLVGLAGSLFVGGLGSIKAGRVIADVALTGPRGARRAASRAFNKFEDFFQKRIDDVSKNNDEGKRLIEATGESSREAIERLQLQRDFLSRYDQKMHDFELRFGIKRARELMKDDLIERGLNERKQRLLTSKTGYYEPDVIRAALRREGLDADDVYKNVLEGDAVAKRKVLNIWSDYVTAPVSNFLRGALERAPGRVIDFVSGLAGGAATTFVYAFEHYYDKKGYTSEEALAAAVNAATDFALEDLVKVGQLKGISEDVTSGHFSGNKNQGGKVDMRAKFYNNGGIACGPKVKRSGIFKH